MTEATRYLLAVYAAHRSGIEPVPPGRIADAVGKSPAATTEMLQRLETRGLLVHEPYAGATLTDDGRKTASELAESYVTLARFFEDVLGLENPHDEALAVAGRISPQVIGRLASTLLDRDAGSDVDLEDAPFAPI